MSHKPTVFGFKKDHRPQLSGQEKNRSGGITPANNSLCELSIMGEQPGPSAASSAFFSHPEAVDSAWE